VEDADAGVGKTASIYSGKHVSVFTAVINYCFQLWFNQSVFCGDHKFGWAALQMFVEKLKEIFTGWLSFLSPSRVKAVKEYHHHNRFTALFPGPSG